LTDKGDLIVTIQEKFTEELEQLLKKYNATLTITDDSAEYGQQFPIALVELETPQKDNPKYTDYTCFELPTYISDRRRMSSYEGNHILTGVQETEEFTDFVLDGVTYRASIDESDGYRSYMRDIEVVDHELARHHQFPGQAVTVEEKFPVSIENNFQGIEIRDQSTNGVVLLLGTDCCEDYYPQAISQWMPENLAVNQEKK